MMDEKTRHGYLVIADISGFTSYLAKVELEHANEILTDLLETIVKEFKILLTISKLEGDAVFAYAPETSIPDGERLLELIENTYVAFRRQRETSRRNTTCTCKACSAIPTLDLKFFVHHGDFIVQQVSGIRELVGSDVNMIHRLMKNHVTENTGWNAYLLLTHRAFESLGVQLDEMHDQAESYEHLGKILIHCIDLHSRYKLIIEAQRIFVSPEEADFSFTFDFHAPLPIVWHWLTDVEKRNLLAGEEAVFTALSRPGGRNGSGASNHCAHGKNLQAVLVETILDWRPFDYFTFDTVEGKSNMRQTYRLEPIENGTGTRLQFFIMMVSPALPRFIRRTMLKAMLSKIVLTHTQAMAKFIDQDLATEIGIQAIQIAA